MIYRWELKSVHRLSNNIPRQWLISISSYLCQVPCPDTVGALSFHAWRLHELEGYLVVVEGRAELSVYRVIRRAWLMEAFYHHVCIDLGKVDASHCVRDFISKILSGFDVIRCFEVLRDIECQSTKCTVIMKIGIAFKNKRPRLYRLCLL